MANKMIEDEIFGKIIYRKGFWKIERPIEVFINQNKQLLKGEIDSCNSIYVKYMLNLFSKEVMEFHKAHPELLNKEKYDSDRQKIRNMYCENVLNKEKSLGYNIEEAALRKREEILEGQTEESFSKIVGKEKAKRCFEANTREEKLASLELKRMRIFKDCIEITCTCDWFKPSGGFSVFEDGSVEMLYVDSMSI